MTFTHHDDQSDLHSLAAPYALDAIDPAERELFEAHLAECETCRTEVREYRDTLVALSSRQQVAPPPALRQSLLEQVHQTPARPAARRTRGVGGWLLGAAAAVLVAVGAITWHPWDRSTGPVNAVQQVIHAGDAQRFSASLHGATVTIVRSPSLDRAVVKTSSLPAAPPGTAYTMWFIGPDNTPHNAGQMSPDASGSATFELRGDPRTAVAAAITIEPAGTSPSKPGSKPVLAIPFTSS